jgi:hypothetical protein
MGENEHEKWFSPGLQRNMSWDALWAFLDNEVFFVLNRKHLVCLVKFSSYLWEGLFRTYRMWSLNVGI